MSGHHRAVEVTLPEAELLADLYGVVFDLNRATKLCSKAVEFSKLPDRDYELIKGLVAAAVVRYFRCFSSGVRYGLHRKDIENLGKDMLATHDYFKALRDKFVAHSVNPFEETYVTATVSERDGVKFPIRSVNPGHHRVMLSELEAKSLEELVAKVTIEVGKRVKTEEERLVAIIQDLPLDTIHSGDLHIPRQLKADDVNRARKRKRPLKNHT